MMCSKVFLFLFIVAELAGSSSQVEMEEETNSESTSAAIPKKEISIDDLYTKIEALISEVEVNHKKAQNIIRNSIIPVKEELTTMIGNLQINMNNKINNLTSEIGKVRLEMNNLNSNITSEIGKVYNFNSNMTVENERIVNELKRFKRLSEIHTINIADELNKTKNKCEMNNNKLLEHNTVFNELMLFKVQSEKYSENLAREFNNSIKKSENNINKLSELQRVIDELKSAQFYPKNCAEILSKTKSNGIHTVYPLNQYPGLGILVKCDQLTEGGGWTIFQNRDYLVTPRENFYRNWEEYSNGFGDLNGEFWLGLETIHKMTKHTKMKLRVDIEDYTGEKRYAKYALFSIENSNEKFRLNIESYSGDAGDALFYNNKDNFTTFDSDNDIWKDGNCAKKRKGAWWYANCSHSNLNGFQFVGKYSDDPPYVSHGIDWYNFRGWKNSMRRTKMMFRPQ